MDLHKTQAEAFRIALDVGAASVDDVVSWALDVVQKVDHPHWSFCELALCSRKYPPDLAAHLREVPGVPDVTLARLMVLDMLRDSLTEHPERADPIARSLYWLAIAGDLDHPELLELAWWAWDALDLADAGAIAQTREDVVKQMRSTLAEATSMRTAQRAPG
ncbi:uncharacterized protein SOCE26_014550 [Sorangium cellulosum]|uniref:Uncharacterized protein n=1 Tax=Sorangium cellulosum TaxID=56 RepID=A0A2L0EL84_SORCE|nr:hypothetical protein [Sorangium cellulosum]AUX40059.1 uncharacterized protein SOCE26_014550 [Sorangium cellulosum]